MVSPTPPCGSAELLAAFGRIDIYVFDQILRGRIGPDMRVLDAGCGAGRNAVYLMRCGANVYGVDSNPDEIARIRRVAADVAPDLPADHFGVCEIEDLPFSDQYFEAVICSAVLHFAPTVAAFEAMVTELWRVLAPGGVLFTRLASSIGIADRIVRLGERRYRLPDGSDRFLVDEEYLSRITADLEAEMLDPLKTTLVQDMRAMTTWVVRKR